MDKRDPIISAAEFGGKAAARPSASDPLAGFAFAGEPTCAQCRRPMRIERRQGLRRVYRCSTCGLLDKTPI